VKLPQNEERVIAVVVTYNRLDMLEDCVTALKKQSRKPDEILVVNNGSTDNTGEWLAQQEGILYINQDNLGGAGGFCAGIKKAYDLNCDWIWLMDDDTIASDTALEELFIAHKQWEDEEPQQYPQLLASKVVWRDGSIHPMNIPDIWTKDRERIFAAVSKSALPIRSSSFVSVMIRRTMVERYGLPIADYFIWNDDLEYTARILRYEFGVIVPKSVVCHNTGDKYIPMVSSGQRFYYEIRNKIWIIRFSNAFALREKGKYIPYLNRTIRKYLFFHNFKPASMFLVVRGVWDGLTKKPKQNS
jgi:rhamnopyranosyl-N-acetylglucosaminyl-diphospho-decaprenol beta-1,3/1,4-galactofuranosyltransferase